MSEEKQRFYPAAMQMAARTLFAAFLEGSQGFDRLMSRSVGRFLLEIAREGEETQGVYRELAAQTMIGQDILHAREDMDASKFQQDVRLELFHVFRHVAHTQEDESRLMALWAEVYKETERLQQLFFLVDWTNHSKETRWRVGKHLEVLSIESERTRDYYGGFITKTLIGRGVVEAYEEHQFETKVKESLEILSSAYPMVEEWKGNIVEMYRNAFGMAKTMNQTRQEKEDLIRRALEVFPKSFINEANEIIFERSHNVYFRLEEVHTAFDFRCKMFEWLSRPISVGTPPRLALELLNRFNRLLGTQFSMTDMEKICGHLGGAVNRPLTIQFVEQGYDLSLLDASASNAPI